MSNIGNGAVNGAVNDNLTAVTANYTVVASDQFVQVTTGTSVIVVTLPAPSKAGAYVAGTDPASSTVGSTGNAGQRVSIQKIDTGNGTVTVHGTLNIGKDYSLANRWSAATFISDGTNWNLTATVS
jgi:hypothetical protein